MAKSDKEQDEGHVGPAYPARYVRLGRISFDTPTRRAVLGAGIVILLVLIVIALIAS